MNPATFLKQIDGIITGTGFKRVIQGVNINTIRTADGLITTGSTTPLRASLETNFEGLQVASSQTVLGNLTLNVPRDYDRNDDYFRLRFLCNSAGDTNTPTVDAAIFCKRAGAALSSDLDPTISAAMNNSTTIAGYIEVNADGLDLRPGDAVSIDFTTSVHTTDAANFYGFEAVYKSDLVYWDNTDRG